MNVKNLHQPCKNILYIISVFFVVLLFASRVSAQQNTVYIDPSYTGSTQNGSMQYPFKSWSSVTWTNGTTYLQKAGTTFNTGSTLIITSKNNITLGSYGTGAKPKIISSAASSAKVIDITSCYNMVVSNLEVASSTGQVTAAVIIDGAGSSNNLIEDCILRDVQWGIRIITTSPGNKILNCEVYNTQDDGIYIKDTPDIEIGYCNIHDVNLKYFVNPDQSYSAGDNIQIASTNSHDFYVHHNTLDHSSTGNKFCFIAWGNNYSGVLEHNTMIGNSSQVTSCIYLSPTTETVSVRYNTIKNGNYGIYAYVANFNVYYNSFIQNKTAICVLNNYHLRAENNVFYNNINNAISGLSGSSVVSKNNIFHLTGSGKAYSTNGSLVSNNNIFNVQFNGFINGYGSLSAWQSASGQDNNSMVANPQFVNPSGHDFKLQPNSPGINAGVNCGYNQDFFGNQVPVANISDIGYFEYGSSTGNQPPVISNQSFSVSENSTNGTVVGQVIATDPNENQTITFSILSGNSGNTFAINSTNGTITVSNSQNLDAETTPQYQLQVSAQDNLGLSSSATVTINVTSVNQSPEIDDQGFNLNENSPVGTVVGTILASDPDQSQQLTYTIVSGNTSGTFALNSNTGVLTVAKNQLLDFESNTSFTLVVKVQDNGIGTLSDQANILITINNVNEAPVVENQSFSCSSNVQNGYIVGQINAFDYDFNQALSYLIVSGNIFNIFSLNNVTGTLTVTNASALASVSSPINLSVKVSDNGNPQLSSTCTVTITVTQANNNPPVINAQTFQVNENSVTETTVGQIVASDPNPGQTLSYTILSGNNSGAFSLTSTGLLQVANSSALNYETTNVFNLVVKVSDNGNPSLSAQAQITININNVNEAPSIVAGQSFTAYSTMQNGDVVGTVQYEDEDLGQTASFAIVGGNTFDAFAINPTTGIITIATSSALKKLTNRTVSLSIKVTDNGIPAKSSTGIVNIKVVKKKELFVSDLSQAVTLTSVYPNPSSDGNFTVKSKLFAGDEVTNITVTDLNGKILFSSSINFREEHRLDLTNLPKGMYLLVLIQGEYKEVKKLVIQ